MALIGNQLGLGLLLAFKTQGKKEITDADKAINKLRKDSDKTADAFERNAEKMAKAMDGFKNQMRIGVKFMTAGLATLIPFALATKQTALMEQGLSDVRSLLLGVGIAANDADEQVDALGIKILNVAPKTRVPIEELTEATYDLVSANLTVNEAMGLIKPTADLAVAGVGTMVQATDVMTASMNTFGKTWGAALTPFEKGIKIANIYAGTIAGLKTTLPDLATAMAFAAGDANVLGVTLAETTVAIGLLQTKGVFGAKAGTTLQAMFRGFQQLAQKSPEALGPIAGLQLADITGKLRPLADIIGEVEKRVDGLGKFEKAQLLLKAFGEESSRAIKLLLGQSAALRENIIQVEKGSALADMTASRQRAWNSQLEIFKNTVKSIATVIGTNFLPTLKILTMILQIVGQWILQLIQQFPVFTRIMSFIIALSGVLLFLVGVYKIAIAAISIFKLMMTLSTIATSIATGGMLAFAASVWAALWPVLLIVASIGALLILLGHLAGIDVLGGIKSIFTGGLLPSIPTIPDLAIPNVGMNAQARMNDPISQEQSVNSQGNGTSYDYSTNRNVNTFHIDGSKTPKQTAKEVTEQQKTTTQRSSSGSM